MKKRIEVIPFREKKNRLSLNLLFSGTTVISIIAALIIVTGIMLTLFNTGALEKMSNGELDGNGIIMLTVVYSLILGIIISFFFGKVFMKPVNSMINVMNRIAKGDFKTRLEVKGAFSAHPTVKELVRSVNTMAEELENTALLRTDFIDNFSHEFKTPIVSISGFAELLKSDSLTEEQRSEYIGIIEEESKRLAKMATNALSLTRIENQTILSSVSFNLSEQIRSCILEFEDKWTKKNLNLDVDLDEYNVYADKELLRQVWINLIDNAVKFTPEGGTIKVSASRMENNLSVSVANTGSHIDPENSERIFRKFYQGDKSHFSEGNGIGLAIVRRIVELHGGNISVKNNDDGVEFTVILPCSEK